MLVSFIITLREGMEAALIIGIIAAYLAKIGRRDLNKFLYIGTASALIASIVVAFIFKGLYGGFEGKAEKLFEGVVMLFAATVLTYMIFWMSRQAYLIKGELQEKIDFAISSRHLFGIASIAFLSVFREGVETVLFLGTLAMISPADTLIGFFGGLVSVIVLGVLLLKGTYRLDYRKFFIYTSTILIFFASGLTAQGVHELQEANVLPVFVEHLWDINPALNPDGSYPPMHEKGIIGSTMKSLFGYNGDPSLLEAFSYLIYWLIVGLYVFKINEKGRLQPINKK
ncbi:MAG: FTR1 family protein [Candidatus Hydrothermarchaeota archaeon]